jgi:uroporphyrinogen decarboxylase
MQSCWLYGCFQWPIPSFEEKVLVESENYIERQNYLGQIEGVFKDCTSMPAFLKYPVTSQKDWEKYRKRFDPDSPERYPNDWQRLVQNRQTVESEEIRGVAVWGFYGFPREMCGPEGLSYLFYDDPELIAEMNEYWLYYSIKRLERALKNMSFDYALIWEDNCYNHGMLHSPDVFRKFMAPHYRALVEFFRKNGIEIISVDSDGNVLELIPLLLDVGVTAIHPFEVAAGMDVVEIGRQYPRLQIWGGLDKRALAGNFKTIDAELERVVLPMKKRGGYAAGIDHNIPPDVSLENFRYFIKRLAELSVIAN